MNYIADKHYTVPNLNKAFLEKNNFRYCRELSSSEDGQIYRYRFPAYKWQDFVTLEGEITLNYDTNDAIVDILDSRRARYAPFYNQEYGDFAPLLEAIYKQIDYYINKIGMKEYDTNRRQVFDMPKSRNPKSRRSQKTENKMSGER